MKRACLLVVVFLTFAVPVHAQQGVTATPFGPSATVVTFTVRGQLLSPESGPAGIPLTLLERLAEESTLAKLVTDSPRSYEVKFAFSSVESFNTWYTSEKTRALLEAVEDVSSAAVATSVALVRPAAAARAGI